MGLDQSRPTTSTSSEGGVPLSQDDGFENLDAYSSYPFDLDHFDPFDEQQLIFSKNQSPMFVCNARTIPSDVWLHICSFLPVRALYVLVTSSKFFFRVLIAYRSQFNTSSDIVSRYSRMGYNYLLEKFLFDAFNDYGVFITDKQSQKTQPLHEGNNDTTNHNIRKRFFNRRREILQDLRQRIALAVCWKQLDIEHADMVTKPRQLSLMDLLISSDNVSIFMSRRNLAALDDDDDNSYGFTEDIYEQPPQNSWTIFMNHVMSPELQSLSISDCHFSLDIRFDWCELALSQHCPNLKKIEIKLYEKYCDWICESIIALPHIENLTLLPRSEITNVFYNSVMTRLYSNRTKQNHLAKLKQLHILEHLKFKEPLTFLTDCSNTLQSLTITVRSSEDIQYFPSSLKELTIHFGKEFNSVPPSIKLNHLEKLAITGARATREQIDNILRAGSSTLKHLTIDPDFGIEYPVPKELPSLRNVRSCFIHSLSRPATSEDLTSLTSFLKIINFTVLNLSGFSVNYTKSIISSLPKSLNELYLEGTISQLPTHIKLQKFSFTINGHQPSIVHTIDSSLWKDSLKELIVNGNPQPNGPLSDNISKLKVLEKLVLTSIGFETIPTSIYKLKNLKYLDLSQNNLKKVSKHIAYMENLEFLDISRNKIAKFDMTIFKLMKKLDRIEFESNPFVPIYESSLSFKNWLFYPTFNTISTACKNRFLEKKNHKQLYEVISTRITWFIELYKHVRFVVCFEYFNIKRQKTERKFFRGAMDKVYCQIYEWDLIQQ
ncbi:hypothetical protein FDP41_004901 [Naegleria fowleri]|uniref:F-box domain-containing protein n=1 Tax=Naegleria fowleri TaxID=5763 RepID=A0A6A5BMR2_NAEFO|nr:uncharacterized protein FDP41_004901 [Naegleria fowleri]KAF0976226.1 hypothetical protein FDP41_004901 [Naegleria fowleri]CAG4710740.1 unnamed protein product [Naegleria fowleri]